MAKVRFPHSISNFQTLVNEGYIYIDRTQYLEKLEQMDSRYHFFLRPRRFGKSLAVSVMEYYYGKQHKAAFNSLFGQYYIGQHPTPLANGYMVLKFDFSGILTDDPAQIPANFAFKVKENILRSLGPYSSCLSDEELREISYAGGANDIMQAALRVIGKNCPGEKIFLIIDEYDHFTNEIIAFNFDNFQQIVGRNGIVRKFFEVVKEGTQNGLIDRIFITGVSPVTLDSLTSGFNIGTNLTLDPVMHDFMGFTEEETARLLHAAEVPEDEMEKTLGDVRAWYNGYLFSKEAKNRLYNPDMVLYFVVNYRNRKRYPDDLLDINIASDYGKIRRMLAVGNQEANLAVLEDIIREGTVEGLLTRQFSFERNWTREDFISLLFYMGMTTIKEGQLNLLVFQIPNHVITGLYYTFFQSILLGRAHLRADDLRVSERVAALALGNDINPLREALQLVLKNLDNRDARQFGEKHVKTALLSLLVPTGIYACFSEHPLGQEYADIVLFRRPPILEPKRQYVFELRHLQKKEATPAAIESIAETGRAQLRRYLAHPSLAKQGDFTAVLWVVAGYDLVLVEEVM